MNDRIYPEKLLKDSVADLKASMLKEQIVAKRTQADKLLDEVTKMQKELQEICPHLNTKTEHGENEGDYYNKGTYWIVKKCVLCEKEIYRQEGTSSYG